jgi:hypothetical protein
MAGAPADPPPGAPGKASLNLLKVLREGLLVAVRGAVHKAMREEAPVREQGLRVRSNGGDRDVHAELIPVKGYGRDDDRRLAREAGVDVHFTKPIDSIAVGESLARLPLRG